MRRIMMTVAAAFAMVAVAACGAKKAATTTTTAPIVAATTTTVPQPAVEVRPTSGPVGTSFQLLASRFQPAETVIFEIDAPGGKPFKGQPHKAAVDGTVSATYRVTSGNPPGTYLVKATGDKGTQASGQFVVTGTSATSTTVAGHPTTTGNPTTTKKP